MVSLIFSIIFFILFIFFCIIGGNYMLKMMLDNILSENFDNLNDNVVNPIDECKKIDLETQETLNFQTATNIPQSPYNYKNYIGKIHISEDDDNKKESNKDGIYCLKKSKLLYDGIWESKIDTESPFKIQKWNLTNGNLSDDYYCSDKLIEVNKPFPTNYIDKTAVTSNNSEGYFMYFNDIHNDILDTEIQCF